MSLARDIVDRIFFPNRDDHAIPVLDAGFSPNQRLEEAEVLAEVHAPDSIACAANGDVFITSVNSVLVFRNGDFGAAGILAEMQRPVGALAVHIDGRVLVAVAGEGVVALDATGRECGRLRAVDGTPLACVTAIAVADDGTIFLTDGSRHNGPEEWLHDLMQKRRGSGRVVACSEDLSGARVLSDGLSWPDGIACAGDGTHVLVAEAWAHRLLAVPVAASGMQVMVKNFAGYPSRICRASAGGYWVAFFAMRTQLTEFVLRENAFREQMMEKVAPELWIGPSLGGHFDYREPTQVGRIKKLGIQKPWAPPRSYGLVARLDETGRAIESLHSRVSGSLHGVTDVQEFGGRLLIASKGNGRLAALTLSGGAEQ